MAGQVFYRKKDLEAIYGPVCPHCGGKMSVTNAGDDVPEGIRKEAERIARGLYNGTITSGTIDDAMTKAVAVELRKAVIEGFGKDLADIDYGTPDYNKLTQLEKNVFHFAGAKNYQQLKSTSLALKDENGKQREYKAFKEEALKINSEYNGRHLRTEYDTAIGSSQMAGKWVDFEQHQDAAPYLRYDTVGDARVRESHKVLDGIIRLMTDEFWRMYYPPNGWKCRCDATQLLSGSPTPSDQIQFPDDVPDMFKTNLAVDGLVFPDKHPFYIDCPPYILRRAEMMRDNVYSKLPGKAYSGDVYVSNLADEVELKTNLGLSRQLASYNEDVYIRPHSNLKDVKNPDVKIGSSLGDFKVDPERTSIAKFVRNSIDSANKQEANIPVLAIKASRYNKDEVWQALRGELIDPKRKKHVSHIWLLLDKKLVKLTRAEIATNAKDLLP